MPAGRQRSTSASSRIGQRRAAALNDGKEIYRAKRKELIHVAATVFRERGYEGATLNDIAEAFGSDRASLYYYVAGKEELLQEAVRGVLDENVAEAERILATDADAITKLRRLVERLIASYEEHYPYMFVYIQEDMRKVSREASPWAQQMVRQTRRFEAIVIKLIEEAIADGAFRDDVPVRLAANSLFGMVNWTHRWFKPSRRSSAQQVADAFCKVFLEGMQKAP
jgi:AcrR family transcriptional regulator